MKKKGLIATLAGDMLETLREDLGRISKVDGMQPFVAAVAKELPKKRRRKATAEEKAAATNDDVAGAAQLAFGGVVRGLNRLAGRAKEAVRPRAKKKRQLGPESD